MFRIVILKYIFLITLNTNKFKSYFFTELNRIKWLLLDINIINFIISQHNLTQ